MNSISRLAAEIFPNVVNDEHIMERATKDAKILDVVLGGARSLVLHLHSVLAVQAVSNGTCLVQRVQDLVGILHKDGEYSIGS